MTRLEPMRPEAFAPFVESFVAGHAADNAALGRWPESDSLRFAQAEFARLLPAGLQTPDNHLYEIIEAAGGQAVGALWLGVSRRPGAAGACVYQVVVRPEARRRGHARRALEALEVLAAAMGIEEIALRAHGHNPGARALYAMLGYRNQGIHMTKSLGRRLPVDGVRSSTPSRSWPGVQACDRGYDPGRESFATS